MIGKLCSRFGLPLFVASLYAFIYIPIAVLVLFSFNSVAFPYHWVSFSWRWYQELLQSPGIWLAFKHSLIVASSAVTLSLMMGLLIVFYSMHSKIKEVLSLFYINLMIPEIVLSVGLLSFFMLFSVPLGLTTLIAGHTLLGLGYVVPILSAGFAQLDIRVIEASLDLGATLNQTFYKIVIPLLMPSIIASGLLVFIISFDDFVLSFFCSGATAQTLPVYIYAMIRSGVYPTINALSTILLLVSSLFVLLFVSLKTRVRIF